MLQSILNFVLAWYNLPFTVLLAVCLLLAGLQWIGLGGDHESGADHDAGVDHDADADHDLDQDMDQDADAGTDHDADHFADVGSGAGFSILAYMGVGRAPVMIILLLMFGSVGLLGWVFNGLVTRVLGVYPGLIFGVVFLVSLGAGSYASSRAARAIGSALPPVSTTATPAPALVGRRGTVISPFVDGRYGMVHLRDSGGTLISVFAITQERQPIRRGEEVIFIQYDPDKRLYEVVRADMA